MTNFDTQSLDLTASSFDFKHLPEYAEYLNIQDEDESRSMGILSLRERTDLPMLERLQGLLAEHHGVGKVGIDNFTWSSCSMMGRLEYITVEEGEQYVRSAYVEITSVY